jgi:hypothetical protein
VEHTRYNSSRKRRQLNQPKTIINPKKGPEAFTRGSARVGNYSEAARQNFFLFQHSYLAAYDFDSARKFYRTANMKAPAWRKWRAKLLPVMRTRVTLLNNWRAKFISLLLATTVWYLIKKEHRDHTLAVWKVLPGASYGNALKGDLQTRRGDRRD